MEEEVQSFQQQSLEKPKSKKWIFIILGVILFIVIISVVIFYFFNSSKETSNTGSDTIDCGTIESIKEGWGKGEPEMVCLGNNILNNCKKSRVIIRNFLQAGYQIIETRGIENNKCIFRMQYGDEDKIPLEAQKVYANTYIDCPLDIEELKSNIDSLEDPSEIAVEAIYSSITMLGSDTPCTGTTIDIMNNP